jgi:Spy/CpxP family protein refolding chaperone
MNSFCKLNFRIMHSKSLLIAIAAFAVTATGAQAFVGSRYLAEAGLSDTQVEALKEARDLRKDGKADEARELLVEAGIDEEAMESLRDAMHQAREAMHQALADGDYNAFKESIEGSPLADIITTEADFAEFARAHALKEEGKYDEAKVIMTELGLPERGEGKGHGFGRDLNLTEEQRDALRTAKQANDEETVRAILKEAGIDEAELKARHDLRHGMKH